MHLSKLQQRATTMWQCEPRLMKICLALGVINLLIYVVMSAFISPDINGAERQMIQLQNEVRRMGSGGAPLSLPLLYQKAGEDISKVHELIPDREQLSDLVLDVSRLADSAGFEIASVSYSPKKVEEFDLLSYSLSFTVNGSYRQLKKFVHLLEISPRIVILDSISLVESQENGIAMRIQITTYFRDQGGA